MKILKFGLQNKRTAMNKQQIDKYFTENYKDIRKFIANSMFKYKLFTEDKDYFMSELYLFILGRAPIIHDEKQLKKFISNCIHQNTQWHNGFREMGKLQKTSRSVEFTDKHDSSIEDDMHSLIDGDIQMGEYQAIIELYRQTETSLEKQVVWDIYFIEGKQTYRSFADYIQRSTTVSSFYIKRLKKDLNEFYQNYLTKNNI